MDNIIPTIPVRLYEAQAAETASELAQVLQIHYGLGPMDAAHAVSQLEDREYIEINHGIENGPITLTDRGLRALGL